MKALLLTLTFLALQQSDCDPAPVQQQQSGYTVRLCSERDLSSLIAYSNQWLAQTDVRFVLKECREAAERELYAQKEAK